MAANAGVKGIDPGSWQVTLLPLPKRFSRGAAYGFCGGQAVGRAETPRAKSFGCWWPGGEPELLSLDDGQQVAAGRAGGDAIPGQWIKGGSGAMGAVVWELRNGALRGRELHDRSYERTWATGAGGGAVVGAGSLRAERGRRQPQVGLLWRDGAAPTVIAGGGDVTLLATDGVRLAGSLGGRAALWPSAAAAPTDLAPEKMPMSEVQALDGEVQVGVAWKGMCARAGLWRGTAASFSDLTPTGLESGRAYSGARGFQVGFVREGHHPQWVHGRGPPRGAVAGCVGPLVRSQLSPAGAVQRIGGLGHRDPRRRVAHLRRGEPLRGERRRYTARVALRPGGPSSSLDGATVRCLIQAGQACSLRHRLGLDADCTTSDAGQRWLRAVPRPSHLPRQLLTTDR